MNRWTLAFEALTVPQTGTSVLQAACIMGDHVTVKAILSTSPSPLDTAIALHYKVVDKNSSFSGKTAAQIVQRFNTLRHKIIQSMIKNADKILVSESCVHLAAKIGEPRHISQLINLGDPVDKLSGPLYGFSVALSIAVAGNRTEVVRALIRHGASIEAVDQHGFSAMQQAALHGAMDTLRLLFDVVTARDTHYISVTQLLNAILPGGVTQRASVALHMHGAQQRDLIQTLSLIKQLGVTQPPSMTQLGHMT